MGSSNEAGSFWGVLARKAKAILEDDNVPYEPEYLSQTRPEMPYSSRADQVTLNAIPALLSFHLSNMMGALYFHMHFKKPTLLMYS